MSAIENVLQSCEECGATIYPEHLERHAADRWDGKLLCPHCLQDKKPPARPAAAEDAPLEFLDDAPPSPAARPAAPRIQALGVQHREQVYKRPLLKEGTLATRCKTFHCKLADAAMVHLNEQINEWADGQPDIAIKFANSTVGVVEGKHNDPHLIVTVFY